MKWDIFKIDIELEANSLVIRRLEKEIDHICLIGLTQLNTQSPTVKKLRFLFRLSTEKCTADFRSIAMSWKYKKNNGEQSK